VATVHNIKGTSVSSFQIGKAGPTITATGDDLDVGTAVLTAAQMIAGDPGTEAAGVTVNGGTYQASAKVSDIGGTNAAQLLLHRHSTTLQSVLIGVRSKSDTSGHTIVADNDVLMSVLAAGWDGTSTYSLSSGINFEVDGTPGTTDMPGQITFTTAADGTQTLVERMRIRATGDVEIDNALDVAGTITAASLVLDTTPLAETSGGTGTATYAIGEILYADASNSLAKLAAGTDGDVLTAAGAGVIPAWETPTAGTVTSVTGGVGIDSTGGATPDLTVDLGEVTAVVFAPATDFIPIIDGGATGTTQKDSWVDIATAIAGSGITATQVFH